MTAAPRLRRTMQDLARTARRAATARPGRTSVAGRTNVVVVTNRGGKGRHTEASASQSAPIIQNGRERG